MPIMNYVLMIFSTRSDYVSGIFNANVIFVLTHN